jgi:acetyl esterase/lipase
MRMWRARAALLRPPKLHRRRFRWQSPTDFQPPGKDGLLKWRIYKPTDGHTKWPVVLIIHGGGWKAGSYFGQYIETCAQDMADAGYYALIVNYRLAPCGYIVGQEDHTQYPLSGRPVEQTSDIKALVNAARADTHCYNHQVVAIGGSGGGSHAMWVALDKTVSTVWPVWDQDHRLQAAVGLSGAYDYSDRTPECYEDIAHFRNDVENYTNTCLREDPTGPIDQKRFSPVAKVTSDAPPIYIINSEQDTQPWHQIVDMQCALQNAGLTNFQVATIPNSSQHAFAYWRSLICDTVPCGTATVADRVIAFLDSHVTKQP